MYKRQVEGRAKIEGDVSVRGDEQATYGKYGQPALEVGPNGNLEITENSSLNLFGGGVYALTSVGGDALKLDGGSVTGKGKLVAIGGSGSVSYTHLLYSSLDGIFWQASYKQVLHHRCLYLAVLQAYL